MKTVLFLSFLCLTPVFGSVQDTLIFDSNSTSLSREELGTALISTGLQKASTTSIVTVFLVLALLLFAGMGMFQSVRDDISSVVNQKMMKLRTVKEDGEDNKDEENKDQGDEENKDKDEENKDKDEENKDDEDKKENSDDDKQQIVDESNKDEENKDSNDVANKSSNKQDQTDTTIVLPPSEDSDSEVHESEAGVATHLLMFVAGLRKTDAIVYAKEGKCQAAEGRAKCGALEITPDIRTAPSMKHVISGSKMLLEQFGGVGDFNTISSGVADNRAVTQRISKSAWKRFKSSLSTLNLATFRTRNLPRGESLLHVDEAWLLFKQTLHHKHNDGNFIALTDNHVHMSVPLRTAEVVRNWQSLIVFDLDITGTSFLCPTDETTLGRSLYYTTVLEGDDEFNPIPPLHIGSKCETRTDCVGLVSIFAAPKNRKEQQIGCSFSVLQHRKHFIGGLSSLRSAMQRYEVSRQDAPLPPGLCQTPQEGMCEACQKHLFDVTNHDLVIHAMQKLLKSQSISKMIKPMKWWKVGALSTLDEIQGESCVSGECECRDSHQLKPLQLQAMFAKAVVHSLGLEEHNVENPPDGVDLSVSAATARLAGFPEKCETVLNLPTCPPVQG